MKPYYPVIRVFGVLLACFSLTMLVPWAIPTPSRMARSRPTTRPCC
jgi:hypothetical protein